ncbi:hypothetical protein [Marinobacter sp.]|uniref:hypothetical protein n=1 Tax=Marinobacter sp. TaxID=50741 RepID=UPI0035671EE0
MPALITANRVECTSFPVNAKLRDGKTNIRVDKCAGSVYITCGDTPRPSAILARHDPYSPSYRTFLEFWGCVFAELSDQSLAFNQLVTELKYGRIRQDKDCPYLFMDMMQPHPEIDGAFALLKADNYGNLSEYNPDDHYVNRGYGLAEDPRVKFYTVIDDFDGHDFPVGYAVSVSRVPGRVPEFDFDSIVQDKEGILKVGKRKKSGHSMVITPEMYLNKRVPELAGDFDDDSPF